MRVFSSLDHLNSLLGQSSHTISSNVTFELYNLLHDRKCTHNRGSFCCDFISLPAISHSVDDLRDNLAFWHGSLYFPRRCAWFTHRLIFLHDTSPGDDLDLYTCQIEADFPLQRIPIRWPIIDLVKLDIGAVITIVGSQSWKWQVCR